MTKTESTVSEKPPVIIDDGWLPVWLRWKPTSMFRLALAEAKLLNNLVCDIQSRFVRVFEKDYLNTILVRSKNPDANYETRTPIILVHGMGAGIGMWCKNLEALSSKRSVYAFDLLGFGRSSRPAFSDDPMEAEATLVNSIEEFRQRMKLDKFILVGHSFGGYLAFSYSLSHPQHVKHLVLLDPWGFPVRENSGSEIPTWIKPILKIAGLFYPLSVVRAFGPFGPSLIKTFRKDLKYVFSIDEEENEAVLDYIYHSNAQAPSGEAAFKALNEGLGWAKFPMLQRASDLDARIPITFIHGRRSWIDQTIGIRMAIALPEFCIEVRVVEGAGHHVYAEKATMVNSLIKDISEKADRESVDNNDE